VDLLTELRQATVLQARYDLAVETLTGKSYLGDLADARYKGDRERTATQLLNDFRKGNLGAIALELPPEKIL